MQWIEIEDGELINIDFIKSFYLDDNTILIINSDDREIVYECESNKEAEEVYAKIKIQINPENCEQKSSRCLCGTRVPAGGSDKFLGGNL